MIKKIFPFIIIAGIAIFARLIYATHQPNILITPDGLGYYIYGSRLFDKFTLFELISQFRTPGYPLFIDLCMLGTGVAKAAIQSTEFYQGMNTLLFFQALIGIIGTIFVYRIMRSLSVTKNISLITTIFISVNPNIISWERTLLTECLTLNLIILIVYLYILILKKPTLLNVVWITISSVALILIRPATITLTPLLFIGVLIYHPNKQMLSKIIPALGVYLFIPLIWTIYNGQYHGYPGFQVYGDINLLGRILQLNLPIKSAEQFSYLYSTMNDYRINGGHPNPYRFLETYNPDFFGDVVKLNTLSGFTHTVVLNNLPKYIISCLPDIIKSTGEISQLIITAGVNKLIANVINVGQIIFSLIQTILFIGLFIFVLLIGFLKKRVFSLTFYSLLSIFIAAFFHIIINTVLGYEDYGRLSVPVIPLLFICGGITADSFLNLVSKK